MKKILLALSSLFILSSVPVFAQNEERIAEIEAQIKELQSELKELKDGSTEVNSSEDDTDVLATFENQGLLFTFKEAYLVDDQHSPSGKSVLFFIEFTNNTGEKQQPSNAIIFSVDAEQESDIQVFDLNIAMLNRYEEETSKNKGITLKDGATIEIEMGYQLEIANAPVTLKGSWLSNSEDEVILELNPQELDLLP